MTISSARVLLRESLKAFRSSAKTYLLLELVVLPFHIVFGSVISYIFIRFLSDKNNLPDTSHLVLYIFIITAIALLLIFIQTYAQIAIYQTALDDGKQRNVWAAYDLAKPFLLPSFKTAILSGLVVVIGFLLLIVPGIFFSIWFAFSAIMVITSNVSGIDAMKKSRELVRGLEWKVFGRLVAFAIPIIILEQAPIYFFDKANLAEISTIYGFLLTLFIVPFSVIYSVSLYRDLVSFKASKNSQNPAQISPI